LYSFGGIQCIAFPLPLGSIMLRAVEGGLRPGAGAWRAKWVHFLATKVDLSRPSRVSRKARKHGGGVFE